MRTTEITAPALAGVSNERRSPITLPGHRKGQAPPNKGMKLPPEPLTRRDVDALLAACPRDGDCGIRDAALIAVLWRCGLRISEALKLEPRDVDADAGVIHVRHGKGSRRRGPKPRRVGVDPGTLALLDRWMQRRARLGIRRTAPVFCTVKRRGRGRGAEQHPSVVRERLKFLAERAELDRRVHPHGFRHTFAYDTQFEGQAPMPLPLLQAALGHNSLATTARYVDHLAPAAVVEAMQARVWAPEPGHSSSPPGHDVGGRE